MMATEAQSEDESVPSSEDAAPPTLGAFESSVPQHAMSNQDSETVAGSQPSRQQRKRKVSETSCGVDLRASKKDKDKAYRDRVKEKQQNLNAENERLQRENVQLKSDLERVRNDKKHAALEAENRELKLRNELTEARKDKELSDCKNESLGKELQSANQRVQDISAQLQSANAQLQHLIHGNGISTSPCKPGHRYLPITLQRWKTFLSPNSFRDFQCEEIFTSPNSSSTVEKEDLLKVGVKETARINYRKRLDLKVAAIDSGFIENPVNQVNTVNETGGNSSFHERPSINRVSVLTSAGFMDSFSNPDQFSGDGEENFVESDFKYAEELQFQEALLFSSEISSQLKISNNILPSSSHTQQTPEAATESLCGICLERRENHHMFIRGSCYHSFCSDCISEYVMRSIQDNIATITCPAVNCRSVLELDDFRHLLAKEEINLWEDSLCKDVIRRSQRLYCPFCLEMFVVDDEGGDIRESECQFCHKLFCAKCGVPWHHGNGCEEYEKLGEDERSRDDLMMGELSKEKKWNRCPQCKFYVEKTEGCPHIICRCKCEFCYLCGGEWAKHRSGCQRNWD